MSESLSKTDSPTATPVPRPGTAAKPRLKADVQDWRRAQIVVAGFAILAVVAFVLAMVATYPKSSPVTNAMLGGKLNTGKIRSFVGPDKECREQVFDNASGHMTKPAPCDLDTLDNDAASNSVNTIGRLESISKAFSRR
jgi:hypothetical protein